MLHWTVHLNIPETNSYAAVAAGHRMYSFGGYCHGHEYSERDQINVLVFNTVSLRWTMLPSAAGAAAKVRPPDVPSMRYGHRAVLIGDTVYIWGGCTWDTRFCTALYAFDVDCHRWSRPCVSGAPPVGRWGHSACVLGKASYYFGGFSSVAECCFNDMYRLDTAADAGMAWSQVDTRGSATPASACHSATAIRGRMFVFGGLDYNKKTHDGVRVFDAEAGRWLSDAASARIPEARKREGHSAFAYNGELYIFGIWTSFGDLWKFNPESLSWKKVEPRGKGPCWRMCCCMVGERLVIFGESRPNDLYILDLSPSLKTLCKLVVIRHGLDEPPRSEGLPHDIRWELVAMTTNSSPGSLHPRGNVIVSDAADGHKRSAQNE